MLIVQVTSNKISTFEQKTCKYFVQKVW